MFDTIQHIVYRIRTAFGDSDITYGGDDIGDWWNYPQGVLQGNTCGPDKLITLSSVVFDILHKRGFGVDVTSSISKDFFKIVGFAYVDNYDLIQSGSDPLTILASIKDLINSWSSLMEVTGGALSAEKSFWYLVYYVWHRGKWIVHDAGGGYNLIGADPTGERVALSRLSCSDSSEMLGVWVTPNWDTSKKYLF